MESGAPRASGRSRASLCEGIYRPVFAIGMTSSRCREPGAQREAPHQIVGDGIPQEDGSGLAQTAHQQTLEPTIASLGVDAFDGGGSLLIDLFGLRRAHALAPLRN